MESAILILAVDGVHSLIMRQSIMEQSAKALLLRKIK